MAQPLQVAVIGACPYGLATAVALRAAGHFIALPELFRALPAGLQARVARRAILPAASHWLLKRVAEVRISSGCNATSATVVGDGLKLSLDDGTERLVDHVLLAIGYRVDVRGCPFFDPSVVDAVRCIDGYPVLGAGFESSVQGLHFVGAGPLLRFVAGTPVVARALAEGFGA